MPAELSNVRELALSGFLCAYTDFRFARAWHLKGGHHAQAATSAARGRSRICSSAENRTGCNEEEDPHTGDAGCCRCLRVFAGNRLRCVVAKRPGRLRSGQARGGAAGCVRSSGDSLGRVPQRRLVGGRHLAADRRPHGLDAGRSGIELRHRRHRQADRLLHLRRVGLGSRTRRRPPDAAQRHGHRHLLQLAAGAARQRGQVFIAGGDNWTGTGTTNTGNNNSNLFDVERQHADRAATT